MTDYDPLLLRQLRKVGLASPDVAPTAEQFQDLLGRIDAFYAKAADDRDLLTRSLDVSTAEMGELHRALASERDRLEQVVLAVSDALSVFGDLSRDQVTSTRIEGHTSLGPGGVEGAIQVAKRRFTSRLTELVGAEAPATDWRADTTSSTKTVQAIRRSFLSLADQFAELLSQTAQVAAIREQLEVARVVQQMLVPEHTEMEAGGISIAATFEPAAQCGGDWWTAHPLDPGDALGRMLVVIGDVTGHGVSSAILTGVARAACDLGRAAVPVDALTPAVVLASMNSAIFSAARRRFLMTAAAGILDPRRGRLLIANAGHGFPYLVRGGTARPLVVRGSPLGSSEAEDYAVVEVPIEPGDLVVWYTDGVVECESPDGEQFSERRFRALCGSLASRQPADMRDQLLAELTSFRAGRQPIDDMTFVLSRVEASG